jgi:hypothetical protein
MHWIPAFVLLLHVAEEYPRFPEWATRHFGATSRAWYVYTHIPLVVMLIATSWLAQRTDARLWLILVLSAQFALATNAVFHVATTLLFKEYSPGLVTAIACALPATAYLLHRMLRDELLTSADVRVAATIGIVVSMSAIASLWLQMDLNWKMRPTNAG